LRNRASERPNANAGAKAWYVLHSKPHKENQADLSLRSLGVETFYPAIKIKPVNPRASKIRPYFPGCLFVHVDLEEIGLNTLQWMPGAVGLVQFDGQPAAVPEHIINQLKRRIEAIKTAGGLVLDGLKRGDPVRITDGPLAGYEALFDLRLSGSQRVRVLLEMLGRLVKVEVQADTLEKIKPTQQSTDQSTPPGRGAQSGRAASNPRR
jgi:transcription elongation factor/antiterminator RfaH